jgi:hypothetical protein
MPKSTPTPFASSALPRFSPAVRACLRQRLGRAVLGLGLVAQLAACGGGSLGNFPGSSSQAPTGEQIDTLLTGTFVDSPVEGLAYVSSSGLSGVTDAQGRFQFRAGDTITFRIAGVDIGTAPAAATLTPASLAGGDEDSARFSNLLVMLQSLDMDGDPANGIRLSPDLPSSQVSDIVALLDIDPFDFGDGGYNVGLQSLATGGYIRSAEEATQHYASAMALLDPFLGEAAGVWQATGEDGTAYVLRLSSSGRYVLASALASAPSLSGVSVGTWARGPQGQWAVQDIKRDTRDTTAPSRWGVGEPLGVQLVRGPQGGAQDQLLLSRPLGAWSLAFHRATHSADLAGAWSTTPELKPGSLMLVFGEPDPQTGQGQVTVLDPEGDVSCEVGGQPIAGVELGMYLLEGNGLSFVAPTVDTNGCAGIHDGQSPIGPLVYTVAPDGSTLSLILPEQEGSGLDPTPVTLYRVQRAPG